MSVLAALFHMQLQQTLGTIHLAEAKCLICEIRGSLSLCGTFLAVTAFTQQGHTKPHGNLKPRLMMIFFFHFIFPPMETQQYNMEETLQVNSTQGNVWKALPRLFCTSFFFFQRLWYAPVMFYFVHFNTGQAHICNFIL